MVRRRSDFADAQSLAFDMWRLGFDAASVIGLRSWTMAFGGAKAQAEVSRMVSEKLSAAFELPAVLAAGGASPTAVARSTLRHYSRKVRANRRRLTQTGKDG